MLGLTLNEVIWLRALRQMANHQVNHLVKLVQCAIPLTCFMTWLFIVCTRFIVVHCILETVQERPVVVMER